MLELDHAIVFVDGPGRVAVDGFTLDPGQRHEGQGTRNHRVWFERSYLELLWIDRLADVRARGLSTFEERTRQDAACPYGAVLRGEVPDPERWREYEVVPGFTLLLLEATLEDATMPFIAAIPLTDPTPRWPNRGHAVAHPNGARAITTTHLACPTPPPVEARDVTFERATPATLTLTLEGLGPWTP